MPQKRGFDHKIFTGCIGRGGHNPLIDNFMKYNADCRAVGGFARSANNLHRLFLGWQNSHKNFPHTGHKSENLENSQKNIEEEKNVAKKNVILLILPIEEISLRPDLLFHQYSESMGGTLSIMELDARKSLCLILYIYLKSNKTFSLWGCGCGCGCCCYNIYT